MPGISCFLCGEQDQQNVEPSSQFNRDVTHLRCTNCGEYEITNEAADHLREIPSLQLAVVRGLVRQASDLKNIITLTTGRLKELKAQSRSSILTRSSWALAHLAELQGQPGGTIEVPPAKLYRRLLAVTFSENNNEARSLFEDLVDQGLVKLISRGSLEVTLSGFRQLETRQESKPSIPIQEHSGNPQEAEVQIGLISTGMKMKYDAFICHASEDKEQIADPLAAALKGMGFNIWYDKFELRVGDSQRRSIDEGLGQSRYGIVILSPKFFVKEWPQKELDGLVAREVEGRKVILPIWHGLGIEDVRKHSPTLADKFAIKTHGMNIEELAHELGKVLRENRPQDESIVESNRPDTSIQASGSSDKESDLVPIDQLIDFAIHPTGMRKGREAAQTFAESWHGKMSWGEFSLFRTAHHFARYVGGLQKTGPEAETFAEMCIEELDQQELSIFKEVFSFAHSKDGMNKGVESAENFAWEWLEEYIVEDFDAFMSTYRSGYKKFGKCRGEAEEFAFEKM